MSSPPLVKCNRSGLDLESCDDLSFETEFQVCRRLREREALPTVLLGWELGSGSGHLHRFAPIVARLLESGMEVVAAMRDVRSAIALFSQFESNKLLLIAQAPIFLHRSGTPALNRSLADVFVHIGYADAALIAPVIGAWRRILMAHRPDVVISDNAPSLNIAAYGELPTIVIGNGWTLPPSVAPLPALLPDQSAAPPSSLSEDRVLEAVAKLGGINHQFDRFADILRGASNFPSTLAMLDPYRAERR